jgi:hypothetical protein
MTLKCGQWSSMSPSNRHATVAIWPIAGSPSYAHSNYTLLTGISSGSDGRKWYPSTERTQFPTSYFFTDTGRPSSTLFQLDQWITFMTVRPLARASIRPCPEILSPLALYCVERLNDLLNNRLNSHRLSNTAEIQAMDIRGIWSYMHVLILNKYILLKIRMPRYDHRSRKKRQARRQGVISFRYECREHT